MNDYTTLELIQNLQTQSIQNTRDAIIMYQEEFIFCGIETLLTLMFFIYLIFIKK